MVMPRLTRRRLLIAFVIGIVIFYGAPFFFARREPNRALAVEKYEQIRPGMTKQQVEELMKGLPKSIQPEIGADMIFVFIDNRIYLSAQFDPDGLLKSKVLFESKDANLPDWTWLFIASHKLGLLENRQWP